MYSTFFSLSHYSVFHRVPNSTAADDAGRRTATETISDMKGQLSANYICARTDRLVAVLAGPDVTGRVKSFLHFRSSSHGHP